MPERDLEALRHVYDVWNEQGLDVVSRDHWHPEIELEVSDNWALALGGHRWTGRSAVTAIYREAAATIEDATVELLELVEGRGEYLAVMHFQGTGEASGASVDSGPMYQVVRMRDGLVDRLSFFLDRQSAERAAGIRA
jgi:ketosteroid isomerase-like protein